MQIAALKSKMNFYFSLNPQIISSNCHHISHFFYLLRCLACVARLSVGVNTRYHDIYCAIACDWLISCMFAAQIIGLHKVRGLWGFMGALRRCGIYVDWEQMQKQSIGLEYEKYCCCLYVDKTISPLAP